MSRQKFNYLQNETSFVIIFKWLSVAKNCLRPENEPLNITYLIKKVIARRISSQYKEFINLDLSSNFNNFYVLL